MADADNAVRDAVDVVVVHVLLLLVDFTQRIQSLRLPVGKLLSQRQFCINRFQIAFEITELLADRGACLLCRVFAAAGVLQIILAGTFAVAAGLLAISGIVQNIQQLLRVFPRFVEQRNILRIANIRRRAGRVNRQRSAVAAAVIIVVVIILPLRRFCCVTQNHFIDFAQYFRRQTLAKIHHQRRVKRQLGVIVPHIAAEVLEIRVFLDL